MLIEEIFKNSLNKQKISYYQTFTYKNKELNTGLRKNERRNFIDLNDLNNKNILDLGCATGAECFWAIENGARFALGIDKGDEQINTFNNLIEDMNFIDSPFLNKIKSFKFDLNNNINQILPKDIIFDTVFCFAINQYISYRKLWHEVPSANIIYVEGGADSGFSEENLTDSKYKAILLGRTPSNANDNNNTRPFFKLIKK